MGVWITVFGVVGVCVEEVEKSVVELEGEGELLSHLPHCVQEQQIHWSSLTLGGRTGMHMAQTELVSSVQPFPLNQLCKPVGREHSVNVHYRPYAIM